MATKKSGGSTKKTKDSAGRRLGFKKTDGQLVRSGNIIVRQRGTKYYCGYNTYMGKDHTIHAAINGYVKCKSGAKNRKYVHVIENVL